MVHFECFEKVTNKESIVAEWTVRDGHCEINMSAIYTKLIQTAGRFCDYYASDLLVYLDIVREAIGDDSVDFRDRNYYFGFRSSGVDDSVFICQRNEYDLKAEYREVWELHLEFYENEFGVEKVRASLFEVHYNSIQHKKIEEELKEIAKKS